MKYIFWGLGAVVLYLIIKSMNYFMKAMKDPDVQIATNLQMSVHRYNKYKHWYDEHQKLLQEYGIESKEEKEYFQNFFKQINRPNEWRRYQEYRWKLKEEMEK